MPMLGLLHYFSSIVAGVVLAAFLVMCAGKKRAPSSDKLATGSGEEHPSNIRAPEQQDAVAEANDPNYATLANVYNVFDDPKIRPPEERDAVAEGNDPNYATLANVDDVFVK